MTLKIAGAGLAGLLAATVLSRRKPVIEEVQPNLPNNHSAVLRFRSSIVGDTLGIPFRPVTMTKTTLPWRNAVSDAMAYSYKNTGVRRSDRSIQPAAVTQARFIAPPDLISRMAEGLRIFHKKACSFSDKGPYVSTIPMPALMKVLEYPYQPKFSYREATNIRGRIVDCEAYVSLLVPSPQYAFSRISITGDELIIEVPGALHDSYDEIVLQATELLGIAFLDVTEIEGHRSRYAKILPIDDGVRKDFIFWATNEHNVFSLGRFATWRPTLLMDDLVQDIRLIDGWLSRHDAYSLSRRK